MTIRIIKLESIRLVIDTVLIISIIIFLLTNLDIKIFIGFNILMILIQHIYFNSRYEDIEEREEREEREEIRATIAECIPLAKVVYCKEWQNNASAIINNNCFRFVDKNILISMHLRFIANINFELHTKKLCNSNEHLNMLINLKPVIGIPINE